MYALLTLITSVVKIYIFLLFAYIILHWLVHFDVINGRQRFVYAVQDFLTRITEPALLPIRRVMRRLIPSLTIDISPIILILLLNFFVNLLVVDIGRHFL